MAKEVNATSTKKDILDAYNELLQNIEAQSKEDPKQMKEKEEKVQIVKNASSSTMENIVKNIFDMKIGLSTTLDGIGDSLVKEFKKLNQMQEAIKIQENYLEDVYQLKINTDSLAAMMLTQKELKQKFDEEISSKKKQLEDEINATKSAFEKEKLEQKAAWDKEKKEMQIQLKEQQEKIKKDREREEEEYNYTIKHKRKKETDEYELQKSTLEKELAEKQTNFDHTIKVREETVSARESEYNELRGQVAKFPSELDKSVKSAVKEISEKLESQYRFEKELQDKGMQGELKLRDQTIGALQIKIKELEEYIKQLNSKTDNAEKSVKEIAIKAIESSSNIRMFEKNEERKEVLNK